MPTKCSVYKCKSKYDGTDQNVRVYLFPKDPVERERWIKALPNANQVSYICYEFNCLIVVCLCYSI